MPEILGCATITHYHLAISAYALAKAAKASVRFALALSKAAYSALLSTITTGAGRGATSFPKQKSAPNEAEWPSQSVHPCLLHWMAMQLMFLHPSALL